MKLLVKETKNIDAIYHVLKHPDVFETISSDSTPCSEEFLAPVDDEHRYVIGIVSGEIIGLMVYHKYKDGEVCHIQVLPEHRKEHAKGFAKKALEFKLHGELYAQIPENYKNVLRFAESFGFEVIDKTDMGYVKNGEPHLINTLRLK